MNELRVKLKKGNGIGIPCLRNVTPKGKYISSGSRGDKAPSLVAGRKALGTAGNKVRRAVRNDLLQSQSFNIPKGADHHDSALPSSKRGVTPNELLGQSQRRDSSVVENKTSELMSNSYDTQKLRNALIAAPPSRVKETPSSKSYLFNGS